MAAAIEGAQDLEAVELRHEQVQHQHVWPAAAHHFKCFASIGGRAADFETILRLQQQGQRFPQNGMIIGNGDAYLLGHSNLRCKIGHRAATSVIYLTAGFLP